jgi:hypothetical protein
MGKEKNATVESATDAAILEISHKLRQMGYSHAEANKVIDLAMNLKPKHTLTLDSNNPFTRNIRVEDVNAVAAYLAQVKNDPSSKILNTIPLEIKGSLVNFKSQMETGPVSGFSCVVKIGTHQFTTVLKPSQEETSPISGKDNERKQQLSDLLLSPDNVLRVIELNRNGVPGNDVEIPKSQFIQSYQSAFSDNRDSVVVKPARKS